MECFEDGSCILPEFLIMLINLAMPLKLMLEILLVFMLCGLVAKVSQFISLLMEKVK